MCVAVDCLVSSHAPGVSDDSGVEGETFCDGESGEIQKAKMDCTNDLPRKRCLRMAAKTDFLKDAMAETSGSMALGESVDAMMER